MHRFALGADRKGLTAEADARGALAGRARSIDARADEARCSDGGRPGMRPRRGRYAPWWTRVGGRGRPGLVGGIHVAACRRGSSEEVARVRVGTTRPARS
ncbi:hypothetical protein GCM10009536_56830 [Streptomyces thermocarboxydus]